MSNVPNLGEQDNSATEAASLARANKLVWQWQRLGLIAGLTIVGVLAVVLPSWPTPKSPPNPAPPNFDKQKQTALTSQLYRVQLADALYKLDELESHRNQLQQTIATAFKRVETTRVARQIVNEGRGLHRYMILREKIIPDINQVGTSTSSASATLLPPANTSAERLKQQVRSVRKLRQKTLEEIHQLLSVETLLQTLVEEIAAGSLPSITLEEAILEYGHRKTQTLSAQIKNAAIVADQDVEARLGKIQKAILEYRARNTELSKEIKTCNRNDLDEQAEQSRSSS
ncbi:MAG: hypothetical protein AAGG44_13305 [Planctomycetota bacterium]